MGARVRRMLAAGAAVVAVTAGVSMAGVSSAQASGCCGFQGSTEAEAYQKMYDYEAATGATCVYSYTSVYQYPGVPTVYLVQFDCTSPDTPPGSG